MPWCLRWLLDLGLAWAAGGAWAQEGLALRVETQALESVRAHLEHRDCPGLVKALNRYLEERSARLFILAGDFAALGVCMKANSQKAARFYQAALPGRTFVALGTLAALYADPAMGAEPATALWWALQPEGLPLPRPCDDLRPLVEDAERFARAYSEWPQGLRQKCNYLVGVTGHVRGESEMPYVAVAALLSGHYRMPFYPAAHHIQWERLSQEEGGGVGRSLEALSSQEREATLRHLEAVSAQALGRFEPVQGFSPSVRLQSSILFSSYLVR